MLIASDSTDPCRILRQPQDSRVGEGAWRQAFIRPESTYATLDSTSAIYGAIQFLYLFHLYTNISMISPLQSTTSMTCKSQNHAEVHRRRTQRSQLKHQATLIVGLVDRNEPLRRHNAVCYLINRLLQLKMGN